MARRFDKDLLAVVDRAQGLRPEAYEWFVLPETFHGLSVHQATWYRKALATFSDALATVRSHWR